jgi:hypothetical protein
MLLVALSLHGAPNRCRVATRSVRCIVDGTASRGRVDGESHWCVARCASHVGGGTALVHVACCTLLRAVRFVRLYMRPSAAPELKLRTPSQHYHAPSREYLEREGTRSSRTQPGAHGPKPYTQSTPLRSVSGSSATQPPAPAANGAPTHLELRALAQAAQGGRFVRHPIARNLRGGPGRA